MRISEISIRRPVFATVISLLLVIFGLVALNRLSVREYPDIERPVVSINTNYRGAAAPVIENKVTQVIEDRIAGIEGIEKIQSRSVDERSVINVEFSSDRDVDGAANDIRDRVSRVLNNLPDEADPPEITKANSGADPVMFLNFSSDSMSILELTDYAERYIVDQLSTVPGVARVAVNGGRHYSMRIWIDRVALAGRRLAVSDIENALRSENVQLPAGRLESRSREFTLRTEVGLDTEEDFKNLVIGRGPDNQLVRLGEVAEVKLAAEDERSFIRADGRSGVGIAVEAQSKANLLDVAHGMRAAIERVRPSLPPGSQLVINVDNAVSIEAALKEVVIALALAFVSVLVVIYAFLGHLRATLIPAITIPVSIVASFTAMYALGYTINTLTLLALVLAIGLVVDDAIVVLENIFRRGEEGESPIVAAVKGSKEIGFAVIATTLTLAAVFVPISFLPGDIGRLFREFGFSLAASVLFSALIALTLTPMLASKASWGQMKSSKVAHAVDTFFRKLGALYERRLRSLIRRPWLIVAGVAALIALGGLTFHFLPSEFAPVADVGRTVVMMEAPEGASFEYTQAYADKLEAIVKQEQAEYGDIDRMMLRVPGTWDGGSDVNSARIFVVLKDWHERKRSASEIGRSLMLKAQSLPGVRVYNFSPGGLGRGFGKPVIAGIGGPDYEQLSQWANTMLLLAQQNPGLTNVDSNYKERKPQIRVAVDRNRAADLGISLQTVGRTLETMLGSRIVTTYVDRGREYNVILQGPAAERATTTDLTNIQVRSDRTGELIPLSNVVTLQETAGAVSLNRFNRIRTIEISANLAPGYTMGEAVKWFQDTVREKLPPGASLAFNGESGEYLKSGGQLYTTFLFALAIVFLVLAAQFESFIHPTVIMVTVPLALLGAVFGLKLYGLSINIFSQIAVVMLIGIAAKNGVLIVEFANQLRDRGVEFTEAVVRAATIRLRPILMTSLCTAFGALPFLFATGAGAEQRKPIGVVVFYGTLVSVLLTLFVVPAVYSLIARRTKSPEYMSQLVDKLLGASSGGVSSGGAAGAPTSAVQRRAE
ncbi:MAG TPA: efflux RND transporter permease subunit [Steroidobacteraceae bacterium]|jgi:multidrug efflux pump|nr:efflux RND transporter permease subunit [Steroidobacteraceae bacterium]